LDLTCVAFAGYGRLVQVREYSRFMREPLLDLCTGNWANRS